MKGDAMAKSIKSTRPRKAGRKQTGRRFGRVIRSEQIGRRGARSGKPNILIIWGDDIGISNLSCYSHGVMGYQTRNIDRLAKEGMMFTDSYGEQSCTAGRSSFITGQSVYRTGLSKVGIPAAPQGLQPEIVTIADLLKDQGHANRPVRQEPSRRPQQVPAHCARLR
jgi:hypothetical protein